MPLRNPHGYLTSLLSEVRSQAFMHPGLPEVAEQGGAFGRLLKFGTMKLRKTRFAHTSLQDFLHLSRNTAPSSKHLPSTVTNMSNRVALLIGKITHARKEWESLSSLLQLKVRCASAIASPHSLTSALGVWLRVEAGLHIQAEGRGV